MAGSWREILESAAADREDGYWIARPGGAHGDAESLGAKQPSSAQLHPPAESRAFGEPELAAFLTRLASRPDAASSGVAQNGPAAARSGEAPCRERPVGNSLGVAVGAAKLPALVEPKKSGPPPKRRKTRLWRNLLAAPLLAAAAGLSAFVLLSPGGTAPEASRSTQSPAVIDASRVRAEASPHRRSRVFRGRHKRAATGRAGAFKRCAYDPDLPGCWWRWYPER